jgi:hypothetical protein
MGATHSGRIPGSRPTGRAPLRGLDAPRFDPAQSIADRLIDLQLERHAWLIRAGEQIREMNAKEASDE